MNKEEIYTLINNNPAFFLATIDGEMPRVRGMLLYKADAQGIIFHTGSMKNVYKQIQKSPNAELCFVDVKNNIQVRISGKLEIISDNTLKDEIANHPGRAFVKAWKENGSLEDFYQTFVVLKMSDGKARFWTMETNFDIGEEIQL